MVAIEYFLNSCFKMLCGCIFKEKEREIEVKQLPPTSQQSVKSGQEPEKGNVNIPVSREAGKN